jgi:SNF2 family DNA or RNA helicase
MFMRRLLASMSDKSNADDDGRQRKTLVFSRSTKMLDAAQSVLEHDGHRCVRIDGQVPIAARASRIIEFQTKQTFDVMLL